MITLTELDKAIYKLKEQAERVNETQEEKHIVCREFNAMCEILKVMEIDIRIDYSEDDTKIRKITLQNRGGSSCSEHIK